jgi:hypothetical protein
MRPLRGKLLPYFHETYECDPWLDSVGLLWIFNHNNYRKDVLRFEGWKMGDLNLYELRIPDCHMGTEIT